MKRGKPYFRNNYVIEILGLVSTKKNNQGKTEPGNFQGSINGSE